MKPSTQLARTGLGLDPHTGSVSPPIYQTAPFGHPAPGQSTGWKYSRMGNPTRSALEQAMAGLEGGFAAFAFSSGMAALTAVLHLFRPGDHLLVAHDLYGVTWRLLDQLFAPLGLRYTTVDPTDAAGVAAAARPETKGILVESLSNPLGKVADLPGLGALARERGLRLIVDNTFLTPYLSRPLAVGAHVVVHSATKYLAGHHDTVAGVVACRGPALAEELGFIQMATGAVLGPQDAWLVMRGMKTLALRLERAQATALTLARWLARHPAVEQVYYPGLPDHPGHARLLSFSRGAGAVLSFRLRDAAAVALVLGRLRLILLAESLGGTETLATVPWSQTHGDLPEEERRRQGLDERLVRLAVGIEDPDDLQADLAGALADF